MAYRLGPQLLRGEPGAGAIVQLANINIPAVAQAMQQRVAHQRVIAKPAAAVVQRGKKQIVLRYPPQHLAAVMAAADGIAQIRMQAIKHGGMQQEVEYFGRQRRENHFIQIAGD